MIPRPVLITLGIYYHLPDYPSIIQEFVLQLDDKYPDLGRTRRFLDHWEREICARIAHLEIHTGPPQDWRSADLYGDF